MQNSRGFVLITAVRLKYIAKQTCASGADLTGARPVKFLPNEMRRLFHRGFRGKRSEADLSANLCGGFNRGALSLTAYMQIGISVSRLHIIF